MACLRNEKTIMSLVKLVITSTRDGASTSRVRIMTIFRLLTSCSGFWGALMVRSTTGICGVAAGAAYDSALNSKKKSSRTKIFFMELILLKRPLALPF
jgi:hypothetical protein